MSVKKLNLNSEVIAAILMLTSFIAALIIYNVPALSGYYNAFVSCPVSISIGFSSRLDTNFLTIVNDGLMSLFFLLIGLELKHHLVLGEYQEKHKLIFPSIAAIGGVLAPALFYLYFNYNLDSMKGWAIPIASDTAFILGIMAFFARHIPAQLRAFVISFSLIDDALALLILTFFYTVNLDYSALIIVFFTLLSLILLNSYNIRKITYYLALGFLLWLAMVKAGIHGPLSGAIVALAVPAQFAGKPSLGFLRLQKELHKLVYFGLIPLFIFINSGIDLSGITQSLHCSAAIAKGIFLGLFLGKPLGIFGFSYFFWRLGLCQIPEKITWQSLAAVSILAGIGFTLSLFIGNMTFEQECPHFTMRSAVILASVASGICGTMALYMATRKIHLSKVKQ